MASFTDITPKFNPYVSQLPIEAMVTVGMEKQKRYDEGIKKIQGYIDNIAGLDVVKDIHKEYLQSKLNELGNNLRNFAASDFSNYQMVNSVTGMTSQIVRDPVIQNAVYSTRRIRKEQERIDSDQKEGKLTPDNQLHWSKQLNNWLGDSDINTKFNGSYVPHFDVFKYAKETFDAIKPDGMTFDQIWQLGADGKPLKDSNGNLIYSPTMTRMEKEGIFPDKVKATLEQIFSDPRVSQQLQITGEYDYRGLDGDALGKRVSATRSQLINDYHEKLVELNGKKIAGKDVQDQIDNINKLIKNTISSYDQLERTAYQSPDSVRGQIYKDDVISRYTTMFGQIKTKESVMDNPAWRAQFDMQKEANARSQWAQQFAFEKLKHKDDLEWKQKNYDQAWDIALLNASKKKPGKPGKPGYGEPTGPAGDIPTQGKQPSDIDPSDTFERDYDQAANTFMDSSDLFIYNNAGFSKVPANVAIYNRMIEQGASPQDAARFILNDLARKSNVSPEEYRIKWSDKAVKTFNTMSTSQKAANSEMVDQYNTFVNARRNFLGAMKIKQSVDDRSGEKELGLPSRNELLKFVPDQSVVRYRGRDLSINKNDLYDIAVYLRGYKNVGGLGVDDTFHSAGKAAYERLKDKGLGDFADAMLTQSRVKGAARSLIPYNITGQLTSLVGVVKGAVNEIVNPEDSRNMMVALGQVDDILSKISTDDHKNVLQKKNEALKEHYGIKPNLTVKLMSGDKETDENTLHALKVWAGEGKSGQSLNLSPDFSNFASKISNVKDPSNISLGAHSRVGVDGKPKIEVVIYEDGERSGGMTLNDDQASGLDLDPNALYEPQDISVLRNVINYTNGFKTCAGDPDETSTYINGDAYYQKNDFIKLMGSSSVDDVKGNIKFSGGLYYPYLYIKPSDGGKPRVRQLPGSKDLQVSVAKLLSTDPTFANLILTKP